MRKNFRRFVIGAAIAAGGLLGGSALALPIAISGDSGGPVAGDAVDLPSLAVVQHAVNGAVGDANDVVRGGAVGGTHPGPDPRLPHPEDYVNAAIQTVASGLDDAAQGLGGIHVGPLPGPVPGAHPEGYVNRAIQTVASGLGDAAQGLGGIHVGPLPGPVPGAIPVPDLP